MRTAIILPLLLSAVTMAAQERIALREGLLIDSTTDVAYVMDISGGIAAVDLMTGQIRWQSSDASKPLAVVHDVLVGQVEPRTAKDIRTLKIATFDTHEGMAGKKKSQATLPPWVRVSIGDSPEGRFSATARPADGKAVVVWQFTPIRRPEDRFREKRGLEADAPNSNLPREDAGILELDLDGGAMIPVAADLPHMIVQPPNKRSLLFSERKNAPNKSAKRWYESADGRNVLQSEQTANDTVWEKYQWVIAKRDGTVIGRIPSHFSFLPFVVRDSIIVFETPPYQRNGKVREAAKLRGINLETGKEVWARPVRETVWRGVLPP